MTGSSTQGRAKNIYLLAGLALVGLGLIVVHLHLREYAFDDAYIHFRIADHFARYGVPYYNLGEPVNASSSSAWTLLLGALLRLDSLFGASQYLIVEVALLNALLTLAGGVVCGLLLARATGREPVSLAGTLVFAL